MDALQITSITNFILASEVFLLAGLLLGKGKTYRSSSGLWALALCFLGLGALLGGIDHGFFELAGETVGRAIVQRLTYISLGIVSFFGLCTTAQRFFKGSARRLLQTIAIVQLGAFSVLAVWIGGFVVVVLNYAPVILFFLIMNVIGLNKGSGSRAMVVGLLIVFLASVVLALRVDLFAPVDRNGLYHLIVMLAAVFLYIGGVTYLV